MTMRGYIGMYRLFAACLLALMLAACSVFPDTPPRPELHDFGAPPADGVEPSGLPGGIALREADAPMWLRGPEIRYRRADHDATMVGVYTRRQWVAPPPTLLTARLSAHLADSEHNGRFHLYLELANFEQVFLSEDDAVVRAQVRATLLDTAGDRAPRRQLFSVERSAPSADGAGAVKGLVAAVDEVVEDILRWLPNAE